MTTGAERGPKRPKQFCNHNNIGLTAFYAEVKAGRLRIVKRGRSTLVLPADEDAWLASLLPARANAASQ